mmetsp:Transcript_5377/g.9894  ORF Transcript_5377/g.9894 Transcript_5377/m.9894 type:complete len:156 (+) Transcript_5377:1208-1675(+)
MGVASQPWPPNSQVYNILLILTDGEIHDMPDTKSLIVEASTLPLSIIIVGVGRADFSKMEELDSDGALLRDSRGRTAARDIVQFVPFRDFHGNATLLAKEVLAEVPQQLTGFMKTKGASPIPREVIPLAQFPLPPPVAPNAAAVWMSMASAPPSS